jgi:hypothetical protein
MPTSSRTVRVVTVASMLAMFAMPALAAAQAAPSATTDDEFCLYPGRTTDTPEIGAMPCDTSRPYMIGHRGFGSSRIPADSEYSNGPKSHLNPDGSVPAAADSADHSEGPSASPSSSDADANSYPSPGVEAP